MTGEGDDDRANKIADALKNLPVCGYERIDGSHCLTPVKMKFMYCSYHREKTGRVGPDVDEDPAELFDDFYE